jgi:hypothetical protein
MVELTVLSDQLIPVLDLVLEVDLEVDLGLGPGYLYSRLYLFATFYILYILYRKKKKIRNYIKNV